MIPLTEVDLYLAVVVAGAVNPSGGKTPHHQVAVAARAAATKAGVIIPAEEEDKSPR